MARKKFVRTGTNNYSKLGLRRKKKLVYRKAKGGSNKTRLNRAGRIVKVKVGFKKDKRARGLVNGLKAVVVYNINDLKRIKESEIAIIGSIGNRKKTEIIKFAKDNKIKLSGLNIERFLSKVENKRKIAQEMRLNRIKDKKERDKKVKEREEKEKIESEKKEEKLEEKVEEKKETADNIDKIIIKDSKTNEKKAESSENRKAMVKEDNKKKKLKSEGDKNESI